MTSTQRADDQDVFAPEYKAAPYWWDAAPPASAPPVSPPERADVVVIGAGYTGLSAALVTARAGRETVVLDAGDPGAGCSTRNGGHASAGAKFGPAALACGVGAETARAIRAEGRAALDWLEGFLADEGIDCGFRRTGRIDAAHSPAAYESLARSAEAARAEDGVEAFAVPCAEQHREIGTDFYHGAVVTTATARLQPALYHAGLLRRAVEAGATIASHCPATGLRREAGGFEIATPQGRIRARDVVVATNGYTGPVTPWLRRRVIPIGSYMIATEPLAPERLAQAFPTDRIACDTRRVIYYYGPSPDGTRIVFGGRVSSDETDPAVTAPRLRRAMTRIFPQLSDVRVSHAWSGFVAYSFDTLPHIGVHDGAHYAMGYCGSGVALSGWLGRKAGLAVLGDADSRSAFGETPFPTRPLYTGRPWFLPAAVRWYRLRDEIDMRLARRAA